MNQICAITEFDSSQLLSVLPTDESERVDQVQAVFTYLLNTYRNDDDILKKLLDLRDLITDRDWIDRHIRVDVENTKVHFWRYNPLGN